ncbi:MAG: lipopolysaccharide kinase InaA family protein [Kiritimatiellia bacterium]
MRASPPPLPPSLLRPALIREAGRACARYVLDGGRLVDIDVESSHLHHSPLQLLPHSPGKKTRFPDRAQLESDLLRLWTHGNATALTTRHGLRFLLSFCREMERNHSGYRMWARIWIRGQQDLRQKQVREIYTLHVSHRRESTRQVAAAWSPHPGLAPGVLHDMLREVLLDAPPLSGNSKRAQIIRCELVGEPVVIKHYSANPVKWKRRWELPRARRAWAASQVLEHWSIPSIRGLGWLESYENGCLQDSYFISRQLPPMETLRVWLRREYPRMSEQQRIRFRHRFRSEIMRIYQHGLVHVDLKLSNLLVNGADPDSLTFYWIDLEDLRPSRHSLRTFIRNLYQLNGSLPRCVPAADRKAFVSGFRHLFPPAASPLLTRYVLRQTRKRHLRQLRRQRGA